MSNDIERDGCRKNGRKCRISKEGRNEGKRKYN